MTLADTLFIVIPVVNAGGNIVLKLSLGEKKKGAMRRFVAMQALGYGIFVGVMLLTFLFLATHPVSLFVVIFSLNYLATLYASRWFLGESYHRRDVIYDALVLVGIGVFYAGLV